MADKRDFRRRVLGAFFLLASLVMLVAGETFLQARLRARPVAFLVYWLGCFGLAGLAFLTAALDVMAVRRRARAEQRELAESALRQIAQSKAEKAPENSGDAK